MIILCALFIMERQFTFPGIIRFLRWQTKWCFHSWGTVTLNHIFITITDGHRKLVLLGHSCKALFTSEDVRLILTWGCQDLNFHKRGPRIMILSGQFQVWIWMLPRHVSSIFGHHWLHYCAPQCGRGCTEKSHMHTEKKMENSMLQKLRKSKIHTCICFQL